MLPMQPTNATIVDLQTHTKHDVKTYNSFAPSNCDAYFTEKIYQVHTHGEVLRMCLLRPESV